MTKLHREGMILVAVTICWACFMFVCRIIAPFCRPLCSMPPSPVECLCQIILHFFLSSELTEMRPYPVSGSVYLHHHIRRAVMGLSLRYTGHAGGQALALSLAVRLRVGRCDIGVCGGLRFVGHRIPPIIGIPALGGCKWVGPAEVNPSRLEKVESGTCFSCASAV